MAASVGISLINPTRVWAVTSLLAMVVLCTVFVSVYRLEKNANRELLERQTDILIQARIADLETGKYRNFIEGIGKEFSDLLVTVKRGDNEFRSAPLETKPNSWFRDCAKRNVGEIHLQICKPFHSSSLPLGILMAFFCLASVGLYLFASSVESRAVVNLGLAVRKLGVSLDETKSLSEILSKIGRLKFQLESARKREVVLKRSKALADFAMQVAHDLRSPLTLLDSVSEQTTELRKRKRDLLLMAIGRVKDIGSGLVDKSEQFLKVSSARARRTQSRREPVSLNQVAQEAVAEKRIQYSHLKNVTIDSDIGDMEVFANIDRNAFRRILSNLIDNSVEAIGARPGFCRLRTYRKGASAVLKILDNGRGIPPMLLKQLPKRGLSVGKQGGLGLGLFTARRSIKKWNGELRLQSVPDSETSVLIELPCRPSHQQTHKE